MDTSGCQSASQSARLYAKADALFDENRYAELEVMIESALAQAPDDPQLLWRLARALHKLADAETSAKAKERLLRRGLSTAQHALVVRPDCGPAHKWCGVLLSSTSAFEGTTASIQNSFLIAEHFERAVVLSPEDATSKHLLGLWCFEVAKLSWLEQAAAAALFATPPTATFEQAYSHFIAAEQMEPGFYPKNRLMLAQTCLRMGRREEAAEWRRKCLECKAKSPEDERTLAEAAKLKV